MRRGVGGGGGGVTGAGTAHERSQSNVQRDSAPTTTSRASTHDDNPAAREIQPRDATSARDSKMNTRNTHKPIERDEKRGGIPGVGTTHEQ